MALIIGKCLRREKKRRYPSAAALAEDIQRLLDEKPLRNEPAGARPRSTWNRIKGILGAE